MKRLTFILGLATAIMVGVCYGFIVVEREEAATGWTDPNQAVLVCHIDMASTNADQYLDVSGSFHASNMPSMASGAVQTSGPNGLFAEFDNNDDYLQLDSSIDFFTTWTTFTICAWIRWDGGIVPDSIVGARGAGDDALRWFINGADGTIRSTIYADGSSYFIAQGPGGEATNTASWTHVAVTHNGATDVPNNNYLLYVNGTNVADTWTDGGTWATFRDNDTPVKIGEETADLFDGGIDDVRIYSNCLSAVDIRDLRDNTP